VSPDRHGDLTSHTAFRDENKAARAGACRRSQAMKLVGIGASTGGIGAIHAFFQDIPSDSGATFVVAVPSSPEHESLTESLGGRTSLVVVQVQRRTPIEADHVYVGPPGCGLRISDHDLEIAELDGPRIHPGPIDALFHSLAAADPDGIGVVLAGSGTDGVLGLKAIKESGGVVMAQWPEEAEPDALPRAAIATGLMDFVLPARELGRTAVQLQALRHHDHARGLAPELVVTEQRIRSAIAQRLHDDLQQRLYSTQIKIPLLREAAERGDMKRVVEHADQVEGWLKDAVALTRRIAFDLSPPPRTGEGLGEILAALVAEMRERYSFRVQVRNRAGEIDPLLNEEVRMLLLQGVRELLFNAVKHSGQDHATIELDRGDGQLSICVRDDGRGFDPDVLYESVSGGGGLGLASLAERLSPLGGTLDVHSAPGGGSRITIRMPAPQPGGP
jgi:signal transduction histidine kinase